ncbi:MAG: hypothetical protein WBO68_00215, partial [Pyrinomonadaceae bacterium]
MLISPPPKKGVRLAHTDTPTNDAASDLRFISDLGRSLLFIVHPKKVANRVADALLEGVGASACVFAAELESIGLISSSAVGDGSSAADRLMRKRFEKWLSFLPPQIGYCEEEKSEFMIADTGHAAEYVCPLHIDGEIKGAIVTAFADRADLTDQVSKLIDAATQMAAMSVNLSAHYESTLNSSINQAREEHRKFTEAVLDSLPVSLYVVDRDYRIVTWNRHREVGVQGIPRDSAIGRDVFNVLARYPQGRLRQE